MSVRLSVNQMVSDHYLENCFLQSFHILHAFWLDPIKFVFLGQGHKTHLCNKWFLLNFLRTIHHRALICNVLIALSTDKTLIDFGLTRSKVKDTIVTFVK